jgi:hypothetical protein
MPPLPPPLGSVPRSREYSALERRIISRAPSPLASVIRLGRFKICGAARHPYIVQAPFIEALQLVARAGTIPPFCKLPPYLVPARIAVEVNCEMQTDRVHRALHPRRISSLTTNTITPSTRSGRDRQHKLTLFLPLSSLSMPGPLVAYLQMVLSGIDYPPANPPGAFFARQPQCLPRWPLNWRVI